MSLISLRRVGFTGKHFEVWWTFLQLLKLRGPGGVVPHCAVWVYHTEKYVPRWLLGILDFS